MARIRADAQQAHEEDRRQRYEAHCQAEATVILQKETRRKQRAIEARQRRALALPTSHDASQTLVSNQGKAPMRIHAPTAEERAKRQAAKEVGLELQRTHEAQLYAKEALRIAQELERHRARELGDSIGGQAEN